MTDPYKTIKQLELNPNGLNLEGKINLVTELVEFMSEKQLDNIIDRMKLKYRKVENEKS
ncbi:hypothetical protein LCGC14_0737870 [marine sediment metagenome]|uniref:Uncharacterized protein n=1 Tax=marine sediment metagenome TaxID=412755 RepID=A0A0F9SSL1_9ZZZZ